MNFMSKDESKSIIPAERIERSIYFVRGNKVLLDEDLATLYGVETKVLNQAMRRNLERFPKDFAFRLNRKEWKNLKSQFVISRWGGRRKLPMAFTEQGVAMLSGVLHSPQAVKVNIEIMRAFIRFRHTLTSLKDVSKELTDLKSFLLKHSYANDREFKRIWQAIEKMAKPFNGKEQRKIGFDLN